TRPAGVLFSQCLKRLRVGDGRRAPVAEWLAPVTATEWFGSWTVVKIPVEPDVTWSHWMVPASANPKPRATVPRPPARSPHVVRSRGNGNDLHLRWWRR